MEQVRVRVYSEMVYPVGDKAIAEGDPCFTDYMVDPEAYKAIQEKAVTDFMIDLTGFLSSRLPTLMVRDVIDIVKYRHHSQVETIRGGK